ncbi:MAG: hypothetical protein CSA97_03155 [Bacteroidetes bacterium]|nr:MAG: hypothetical protein CSA97_03155 [Bacteroidota bacterium]
MIARRIITATLALTLLATSASAGLFSRLVTLETKKGSKVTIKMASDDATESVTIKSGSMEHTMEIKASQLTAYTVESAGKTIEIIGDVEVLDCSGNGEAITGIHLTRMSKIKKLNCSDNQLTYLRVESDKLEEVDCSGNRISQIKFEYCDDLEVLNCAKNRLAYLDLTAYEKLEVLNCKGNQIKTLKMGKKHDLEEVYVKGNPLDTQSKWRVVDCLPDRSSKRMSGKLDMPISAMEMMKRVMEMNWEIVKE